MGTVPYKPTFEPAKFKELMLYAAEKSLNDPTFGATKLNKILFFSDFLCFGLAGHAITGATYQRLKNGPAPIQLLAMEREIEAAQEGYFVLRPYFNLKQKRLVAARPANPQRFSSEELDLINDVITNLEAYNASDVSNLSHIRSRAWQIAEEGEEIPYSAVFLSSRKATPSDIQRGRDLARQYGWLDSGKSGR
ncbi:MAG TPA: Panacea domain-containing protein [Acidobacteriota bacterium]|jgi:hypothetical protein|nr:Panacea domain-containing protein [Acidobacteriota bacterium]